MSIAWGTITDGEIAAGIRPSAVLFSKLVNNPRAVFLGDESVPYSKLILAEGCQSPVAGALNDFLLSDGLGGVDVGQIPFSPLLFGLALQPIVNTNYTPFPVNGVYTIMIWGNGGAGASSPSPPIGPGNSGYNCGGSGGFVKGYINAKTTDQITVSGFVAGSPAFVYDVAGAWRLDAGAGGDGAPGYEDADLGIPGTASMTGFVRGYAQPGTVNGTGAGQARNAPGPSIAGGPYGKGGNYGVAGSLGAVYIARGVF